MNPPPQNLKYTSTHEWAQLDSDGTVMVGITEHAQQLLGDMVFVELPALNQTVQKGVEIAVVESVKAASDIYSPLSGKIIGVNEALNTQPELINQDPYDKGWIFILEADVPEEFTQLLNADDYQKQIT
jgi:glycine cleavage system H protein